MRKWLQRVWGAGPILWVLAVLAVPLLCFQGPRLIGRILYWWSERSHAGMEISGLSLAASADKNDGGALVIHYRVRNGSSEDVAVFVGIPAQESAVKAYMDVDGSVLHVRKAFLPQPPGAYTDYWFLPYVAVLRPGEEYAEDIVIPREAKVENPALELAMSIPNPLAEVSATNPVRVGVVVLHVGAYRVAAAYEEPTKVDHAPPGLFFAGGFRERDQAILETIVPLPETWTVLDYE